MFSEKMTIRDIAAKAGVSRATVSRYLNGGHWVSAEAAHKISTVIDQTGYVANGHARSLATGRSNSAAFLLGEPQEILFSDPNFVTLLRSVADALGQRGMALIMMTTDNADEEKRNLNYLRGGHVDGVLLVSWHNGARKSLITSLHDIDMPLVVAEYPSIDVDSTSYVHVDDYHGAGKAVEYLLKRGGKHFAMIAGPQGPSGTLDRIRGFQDRLHAAGIEDAPIEHGDYSLASGRLAMQRLLDKDPSIDAVFASSDPMAAGALKTLREQGRRIPQDVQVIGFDDQPIAKLTTPPLTTLHQPFTEIGTRMVDQLVRIIDGEKPSGTTLPLDLVVRDSTR
ncbi:MAG: LacI family transcriptional regulator [Bifidobacteriaceae bacterium]|jgi:DNA-binding LacI/PurR family transcriptional regulator|nr:LacI family transcriptional regulator [Bifidobacteriaceae bacterium]MCI1979528.1 LacI family transcriptional regulator [Bifidobacteriaceae bacterium]